MSAPSDRTPPRHSDAIRQRLLAQLDVGDLQIRRHLQLMANVVVAQMLPGVVVSCSRPTRAAIVGSNRLVEWFIASSDHLTLAPVDGEDSLR